MTADRPPVDLDEQRRLLALAREAIAAAVRRGRGPRVADADLTDGLAAPRSAFVTLTEGGELRGCIGRLDPGRPLWENVIESAMSAAVGDPRFDSVEPAELDDLRIEISVLDLPVPIEDPEAFDPSIHGIIVERGPRRGLLLPKVAHDYGWGRLETLRAACWKAGLPQDAWRDPGTSLSVFAAFVFADPPRDHAPGGSTPGVDPA